MQPNDQPEEFSYAASEQSTQPVVDAATPKEGSAPSDLPKLAPVNWHAVEYIQIHKTPLWYIGFFVVVIGLMAAAILLSAWTFAVLIPVMAVTLLLYTHRPPREVAYTLSEKGLYINDQIHPMGEFKGFGVIQEHELHSLVMIPVKRFRPGLTVYFPTEAGEAIVDMLGAYLPMEQLHPDVFDKIIRKLRI